MPNSRPHFLAQTYYHVYNRWRNKWKICFTERDFKMFFHYLFKYIKEHQNDFIVESFCLLPNHFHILFFNYTRWHQISQFMKKLQWAYATFLKQYYGDKNGFERWICVFDGRFKAKMVFDLSYQIQCKSYIVYNAVRHKYVEKPEERIRSNYWSFSDQEKQKLKIIWEQKHKESDRSEWKW